MDEGSKRGVFIARVDEHYCFVDVLWVAVVALTTTRDTFLLITDTFLLITLHFLASQWQ